MKKISLILTLCVLLCGCAPAAPAEHLAATAVPTSAESPAEVLTAAVTAASAAKAAAKTTSTAKTAAKTTTAAKAAVTTAAAAAADNIPDEYKGWHYKLSFFGNDKTTEASSMMDPVDMKAVLEVLSGKGEPMHENYDTVYKLVLERDGESVTLTKRMTENGWKFESGGMLYPLDERIEGFAAKYGSKAFADGIKAHWTGAHTVILDESRVHPFQTIVGTSCKWKECPTSNYACYKAVCAVITEWLNANKGNPLIDPGKEYFFDDLYDVAYIGNVNGGVDILMQVKIFTDFYDKKKTVFGTDYGDYTAFHDYYKHASMFVFCRWENGVCTIKDYLCPSVSVNNSVHTKKYNWINSADSDSKCFFDFLNDKELVKRTESSEPVFAASKRAKEVEHYGEKTYAHNAVMQPSGEITFIDIYYDSKLKTTRFADKNNSSIWRWGANNSGKYLSDSFSLIFDDYNGNGIPDFASAGMEREDDGTRYDIYTSRIAADTVVFNSSVFIPDVQDDTIRLQLYDTAQVIGYEKDSKTGEYYPCAYTLDEINSRKSSARIEKLDDIRMYSQRWYLPNKMGVYPSGTNDVICYIWNNTKKKKALGGSYTIERLDGDKWVSTGVSGKVEDVKVRPYCSGELKFDISGLSPKDDSVREYRIALKCGGKTVYGGFRLGSRYMTSVELTADAPLLKNGTKMSFTVKNNGLSLVSFDTARLYRNGKPLRELDLHPEQRAIAAGESAKIELVPQEGMTFGKSKYRLELISGKNVFSCEVSPTNVPAERLHFFPGMSKITKTDGGYIMTLKNSKYTGETLENYRIEKPCVLKDGEWKSLYLAKENGRTYQRVYYGGYCYDDIEPKNLLSGETVKVELVTDIDALTDDECDLLALDTLRWDYMYPNDEELDNRTYLSTLSKYAVPKSGDIIRVTVIYDGGETYAYAVAP